MPRPVFVGCERRHRLSGASIEALFCQRARSRPNMAVGAYSAMKRARRQWHSLGDAGQNAERCRTGDSRPGAADGTLSRLRYPVLFPVPLAPKTREQIVTRRDTSNGKASDFNRRRTKLCFGKGEVESQSPPAAPFHSLLTETIPWIPVPVTKATHIPTMMPVRATAKSVQVRSVQHERLFQSDRCDTHTDRLCIGLSSAQWH